MLIPDLINFFLTGACVTEYTNATKTQMLDKQTSTWDRALEQALKGDYLAQERVNTSREVFPFVDETGVHMIEQLLDLDPLLFFGKVSGAFTRLSSSSLANVTSGAGMVPTMIVD